ncbi:MAG: hypothetical protein HWD59_10960 [Coxiellaceae bacterium]|nr:MAG: hypothetical protein HWD59_10960 [Coxiellaceae bacterium]
MLLLATRKIDQADANLGALKTSPDLLTNKNCITDIDVAHEDNLKQINQLAQIAKTAPLSRAQQQILQKSADDCATLIAKPLKQQKNTKKKQN